MQCHSGIFKCPRTFEGHCMQNKSHKGYVQNDVFPSTCNTFPVATELNILGWWTMEWLYTLQWVFSQSHCCSNCSVFTQMVRQESAELTRILLDFQTCARTHTHTHTQIHLVTLCYTGRVQHVEVSCLLLMVLCTENHKLKWHELAASVPIHNYSHASLSLLCSLHALPLHPVFHVFSSGELLNKDTSAKVINK